VSSPDRDLVFAVEQFLYREARLLDEGRFDEWLDLLDDDVRYVMPTRPVRQVRSSSAAQAEGNGPPTTVLHYLEEDRASLTQRIERLRAGNAWAEVPPSRTTRVVSNVVAERSATGTVAATSNLVLYRQRLADEVELFAGRRDDRLVPAGEHGFRLAARTITLTANVLPGKNLSLLF
jgi:3-phenylpropionate/cinnamic acid dioxygenase small subunit